MAVKNTIKMTESQLIYRLISFVTEDADQSDLVSVYNYLVDKCEPLDKDQVSITDIDWNK